VYHGVVPMIDESGQVFGFFLFLIDFDSDFEKNAKKIWIVTKK
jgi:hypothetical protein